MILRVQKTNFHVFHRTVVEFDHDFFCACKKIVPVEKAGPSSRTWSSWIITAIVAVVYARAVGIAIDTAESHAKVVFALSRDCWKFVINEVCCPRSQ